MVGRVPQPSRKTEKTMHLRRSVAPFKAFLPGVLSSGEENGGEFD